jgi:chemotaxis protein methyltransferase WspC
MNEGAIETWLQLFAGLDASTLGAETVARVVRERMRAIFCPTEAEYLACLTANAEERHAFIDRVIVPETWFFRDRPAFEALGRHVVGAWREAHPRATLRVLSLPCSTGEEAYSLAMALDMAGYPLSSVQIDAVDLSPRNLEQARLGVFGPNSFRGNDLLFRDRYLDRLGEDHWRVRDHLRAAVRFEWGNILAENFHLGRPGYDAIFCRNLLIYFNRATQAKVIRKLDRLLVSDGWFAVGPAESVLFFKHGYASLPMPSGFLLQRRVVAPVRLGARPEKPRETRPCLPGPFLSFGASDREKAASQGEEVGGSDAVAGDGSSESGELVAEVERTANRGNLEAAMILGEKLLGREGASAPLFFLMAILTEAAGDPVRAEFLFRKTLYLDPERVDVLAHLALLAERNGHKGEARRFRERTQRVLKKGAG